MADAIIHVELVEKLTYRVSFSRDEVIDLLLVGVDDDTARTSYESSLDGMDNRWLRTRLQDAILDLSNPLTDNPQLGRSLDEATLQATRRVLRNRYAAHVDDVWTIRLERDSVLREMRPERETK